MTKTISGRLLRVERQIHSAQTWTQAVNAFNCAKRRLSATLQQSRMAKNEGRVYDQTIVDRSMSLLIEATKKKAQLAVSRPWPSSILLNRSSQPATVAACDRVDWVTPAEQCGDRAPKAVRP